MLAEGDSGAAAFLVIHPPLEPSLLQLVAGVQGCGFDFLVCLQKYCAPKEQDSETGRSLLKASGPGTWCRCS